MATELERIDKVIASLGYRITILANIIRPMVESGLADKPDDATDGRWVLDLEDYEYFFGPCLMLIRRSKGTVQVTREYLFGGKSFRREADMVKYLDGIKRARR